jgi:ribosomal protein L2
MFWFGTAALTRRPVDRTRKLRKARRARNDRRAVFFEALEPRHLLSVTFLDTEDNDSLATAQPLVSPGLSAGVVDMITASNGAVATGDPDYYSFQAAVPGELRVSVAHAAGSSATVTFYDNVDSPIGAVVIIDMNSPLASLTVTGVDPANVYKVGIVGDSAEYQLRIWNSDANDSSGGDNSQATATNLGAFNGAAITSANHTIIRPDRDYYQLVSDVTGPVEVRAIMPPGTGAATGANSPTNLGIRVRDASGVILATSNGTTTDVDLATFQAASGGTYYIEVYSGSVGQVNKYDLEITQPTATVTGFKFLDINGDGFQDWGEPGLAGWTIYVDADDNGVLDPDETSVTTASDGSYSLTLPPGTHVIREVLPTGWAQTYPGPAAGNAHRIHVSASMVVDHVDFGNSQLGQIIVEKQTLPDGSTEMFAFTSSYSSGFSLSDGQTNNSSFLAPGSYTVSELVPTGWSLSNVEFVTSDGSDTSSWTGSTATIDLDPGETITVRFHNTQLGQIIVEKQTLPDGSPQAFDFTPSYGSGFSLSDGQTSNSGYLASGSHTVSELVPAGWSLSNVQFVTSDGSDTSSWTGSTATIDLDPGETITVRFHNTQLGQIIVEKQTLPDGSPQAFNFTPSYGGGFSLTDGQTNNSGFLAPGSYTVSELVPAGWSLSNVEFVTSDGSDTSSWTGSTATIDLDPGETITVRFHNTQLGQIIVEKQTLPDGSPQAFNFTPSYGSGFSLTDGQTSNSGYLTPGSYTVSELVPTGWSLSNVQFVTSDGSDTSSWTGSTATIDLDPGETITVRFHNTQLGQIIVEKQTLPDGSPQAFDFTPNYGSGFSLSDGQTSNSGYLASGSYTVSELVPTGWSLSNVEFVTSDGSDSSSWTGSTATIDLDPGETITVRFHNTQLGSITVIKDAVPDDPQDFDFTVTGTGLTPFSLDDDADPTLSNTQTFTGLLPGVYTITETAVAGWTLTNIVIGGAVSAGISGSTATINLAAGETVSVRYTNVVTPAFTGVKYYDANENGGRDVGEPGLPGWTIELYADVDNNGIFDPNGPFGVVGADGDPIATATTDANGNYSLGSLNLPSGRYFIREVIKMGWKQISSPTYYTVMFSQGTAYPTPLDFGNASCVTDLFVPDGQRIVTAYRDGLLTLVLSQGTFTVTRVDNAAFDAYDGAGGVLAGVTGVSSVPDAAGQRVDILIGANDYLHDGAHPTPPGTQFIVDIMGSSGAGALGVLNAVNVDVAGSLALIITGTECGELIVVADDSGGTASDAKAIYFGEVSGDYDGGADLTSTGIKYNTPIIDAMFGIPTISRVEVYAGDGDDIIRITDEIVQQTTLDAGPGNDNVRAGSGRAYIAGGAGHDLLIGGAADDIVYGGAGHDRIYGGAGADRVYGDAGDDWIAGGDGDDPLLRGGDGNDRISGGNGRDRLYGDAGFDTLYRDTLDYLVDVGAGGGTINSTPPDPVEQDLLDLLTKYWNDLDADANDTLDELINSILP